MGMQTPIHRIPKVDSEFSLAQIAKGEFDGRTRVSLSEQLESLFCHDQNEDSLGVCLDWAMEIRNSLGIGWSESIDLAMILYYG